MRNRAVFLYVVLFLCAINAVADDLQTAITKLAPTAVTAVMPISYWVADFADPRMHYVHPSGVIGTAFLIDDKGDFITAAHVLDLTELKTPEGPVRVRLTATIKQASIGATAVQFKVLETDKDHDLALCQIPNFKVFTKRGSPTNEVPLSQGPGALSRENMFHPFASLAIAPDVGKLGDFVVVSGYPLGSWTQDLIITPSASWPTCPSQASPAGPAAREPILHSSSQWF